MKYVGNFRMADFADFGYKVYDGAQSFMDILSKMDKEQDEFVMEEDSLLELLGTWLDNSGNNGLEVGASRLFSELKEIANNGGMDFWYKSSRSLGMTLIHREKNLKRFINFEIIKRPGRPNQYRFEKRDDDNIT